MAKNEITMTPELEAALLKQAELEKQNAELRALLESKESLSLSIGMSDFSSGTVSVRGLGRNAVSLYPAQWEALCKLLGINDFPTSIMGKYIKDHANELRCARFATAFAAKLGKKWPTGKSKTDPDAVAYQEAYNTGKVMATKDASLDIVRK
jgi:hypothetical protein